MSNLPQFSPQIRKRIFASGFIGNLLEVYDVTLCAFLAQIIGVTFFPSESGNRALFNTFYILLVGYLSRPFGSFILGYFADRVGRKKMLVLSILLLGVSTALIGIIPSYEQIGIFSAIIFFIARIFQNFFAGGEYISSIAYLIENSEKKQRGFFGCWSAVGVNSGALVASLVVFVITYFININMIPSWSWRFAFLFSLIGMAFGLWLRYSIPESIAFVLKSSNDPNKKIFNSSLKYIKSNYQKCFSTCGITWLGVCITYSIFIYAPIHMTTINHFTQHEAFGLNTIAFLLIILLIPTFGSLSDYIDKIKMMMIATFAFAFLALPYFWYVSYGNYTQVLLFHCLMAIPSACFFSIAPVVIAEIFPVEVRCTAIALIYQTVASLAAGLTPIILLQLTYSAYPYSPGFLIVLSSIFGYFCLSLLNKSSAKTEKVELSYSNN